MIEECNKGGTCNVVSLKIDVDQNKDITRAKNVRGFPTFILFKDEKELDRMSGADKNRLERMINKYKTCQPPSQVKEVTTLPDLNQELQDAGDKLVVVGFFADWCPPSACIKPSKS